MIIETQDKKRFVIKSMDRMMTMGWVVEEETNQLVLGWSRDEDQVHVLAQETTGVWRGTELRETLVKALEDLRTRIN